ncbi:glycosyltransferase family 2 protein [Ancylothrix sp. C2]|uniref:glycosyltransferase family 2 protein n=1 Tax=Ancylothrix sp. D3o TaxID=2953691 RepID=UPI0021BA527C|nr:glycosyltransferase family 2 protein [Ancylothrix sp. D3o]MCT7949709.1 glycosyltransferase family 2 protein [Ancylothrix sp. D3o]
MYILDLILLAIGLGLLIPTGVLFVECVAAAVAPAKSRAVESRRPTIAVLVPAHNEAAGIGATLKTIVPQLLPTDRLVVIADNCTDNTAEIAHACGAIAIERHDTNNRGKGYALDYGLKFLANSPPEVVIIIDADCIVEEQAIEKIAGTALQTNRPVQATYIMERPETPSAKNLISALAFTVKNLVRPAGLKQIGLPCLLTGTGMAFPWAVIAQAPLASGNIVEDMQLAVDLALAGHPAIFCPDAKVTGVLPNQTAAATTQRTRWEHGHLQTLLTQVPRLLQGAFSQKRFDLAGLALDLSVPPLSLLVMLWLAVMAVAIVIKIAGGSWVPTLFLASLGGLILVAIFTAWAKFGRSDFPLSTLLAVPVYILWKIPVYLAFLVRRQTNWVRTQRDAGST